MVLQLARSMEQQLELLLAPQLEQQKVQLWEQQMEQHSAQPMVQLLMTLRLNEKSKPSYERLKHPSSYSPF